MDRARTATTQHAKLAHVLSGNVRGIASYTMLLAAVKLPNLPRTLWSLACFFGLLAVLIASGAKACEPPPPCVTTANSCDSCSRAADCSQGGPCTTASCIPGDNPVPPPNCTGKLTAITFRYTGEGCEGTTNTQGGYVQCAGGSAGESPVRIVVRDKKNASIIYGDNEEVGIGETAGANATAAGLSRFKAETRILILDDSGSVIENLVIHTSCFKPLNLGDRFGSLEVVGLTTTQGGQQGQGGFCNYTTIQDCTPCMTVEDCHDAHACTIDDCAVTPYPPPNCTGRPTAITFRYTGDGCDGTTNTQGGQAQCTGGAEGASPVRIVVRDKRNASIVYGNTGGVAIGDIARASAARAGLTRINPETRVVASSN